MNEVETAIRLLIEAQREQYRSVAALQTTVGQLAAQHATALPGARPSSRLTKQTAEDDVEAYLEVFERVAISEGWPAGQWASILAPFLTGEAQRAYQDLDATQAADFPTVKRAILAHHGLTLASRAQRFHSWRYQPEVPIRGQVSQLTRLARGWLMTGEGVTPLERVVIDKCIRSLPADAQRWAAQSQPNTVDELNTLLENFQVAQ